MTSFLAYFGNKVITIQVYNITFNVS